MKKLLTLLALLLFTAGCVKKVVTAPVPGARNPTDAYAFRTIADAEAALHSVKTWEQCSEHNFPATVKVDEKPEPCDPNAGAFQDAYKAYLNVAINSFNVARGVAKAYHDGATQDENALMQDLTQLGADIGTLLTKTGGH